MGTRREWRDRKEATIGRAGMADRSDDIDENKVPAFVGGVIVGIGLSAFLVLGALALGAVL